MKYPYLFLYIILIPVLELTTLGQESKQLEYSLSGSHFKVGSSGFFETPDSGIVIAVNAKPNPGYTRGLIFKERADTLVFSKSYTAEASSSTFIQDAIQLDNGDILACGYVDESFDTKMMLLRTDSLGNLIWAKTYQNSGEQSLKRLYKTSVSNEFIALGVINGGAALIRFNQNGNLIFSRKIGAITSMNFGLDMIPTSDGGYMIVCGSSSFNIGQSAAVVIKLNSLYNVIWTKLYGIPISSGSDLGCSVHTAVENPDGTYLVMGSVGTSVLSGDDNLLVLKITNLGDLIWSKVYDMPSLPSNISINPASDSTYILNCHSTPYLGAYYDPGIMKMDKDGNVLWGYLYTDFSFHDKSQELIIRGDQSIWLLSEHNIVSTFSTLMIQQLNPAGHLGCNEMILPIQIIDTTIMQYSATTSFVNWGIYPQDSLFIVANEIISRDTICLCKNLPDLSIMNYGCSSDSIYFHANVYPDSVSYDFYWDFGDGSFSNQQDPTHHYNLFGDYHATLQVTDSTGCSIITSKVISNSGIADDLTFSSQLIDSLFYFSGDLIDGSSWQWDFGDGTIDSVQNPIHIYSNFGDYFICLTASNFCGSFQVCDSISFGCQNLPTAFSVYTHADTAFFSVVVNSGIQYHWEFGDGLTDSVVNPVHVYNVDSVYNEYLVCLTTINWCDTIEVCDTIVIDYLELTEKSLHNIWIFPNPGSKNFTIVADENFSRMMICDLSGKIFYDQSWENAQTYFELETELEPGLYFFTFETNVKKHSIKVVVL